MCRFPAEVGAFAVKCERFFIVQPAKDGGFFYGHNSGVVAMQGCESYLA